MFLLIVSLCYLQALPDQTNVGLPGFSSTLRFFLKYMQHVDCICKTDGINRSVRVPIIFFDDLQNSRPLALPRLCSGMFAAILGRTQGKSDTPLNFNRETGNVLQRPIQSNRAAFRPVQASVSLFILLLG